MYRFFFRWICLFTLSAVIGNGAVKEGGETARRVGHVFIISFDGGGGVPGEIESSEKMPEFKKMVSEGASTWRAQTINPSTTLPSHTSMLTGVDTAKHRITWNDWKEEKGLVRVPTVFSVAKSAGLTTALFAGKAKFRQLNLSHSLDFSVLPEVKAKVDSREISAAVAKKLPTLPVNLCFIHFADPDSAGHKYGWGSPEQGAALADCDDALKVVMQAIEKAGLTSSSVVILTADHGGHGKGHGTKLPADMTIPWVAWGKGVRRGVVLKEPITTYDTAATALWLLGIPIPREWDGKPVKDAFRF